MSIAERNPQPPDSSCRGHVPLSDLRTQFEQIRTEIAAALRDVAESGTYVLGPKVAEFEAAFAAYLGVKHCVAVNSGTSALHLALLGAGVGPGDEVVTTPMTFIATAWAISYVGATPVFVDVEPATRTLNPTDVEKRITPRTRAILPVHLYGQPADLKSLREIGARYGIPLIEDAAQSHGARFEGTRVGTLGLCGCFSFYPGKNLGAYGEGGAVVTNDSRIAARLRTLRDHAQGKRYHHEEIGFNYRMDAFQGAILSVKLRYLDHWTSIRRDLAERYLQKLDELRLALPYLAPNRDHVWHLFVVLHRDRDRIQQALTDRHIQTGLHYPVPLHMQRAYRHLGYREGDFPVAEQIARECLTLPLFPEMSVGQQDAVIDALRAIVPEVESR